MAVVGVADIYINEDHLRGLTDVRKVPPPNGVSESTYSFRVYLEGSTAVVAVSDKNIADAAHAKVLAALKAKLEQFLISTGGTTLVYTAVNVINEIGEDPVPGDKNEAAFTVCMDGVSIVLAYVDYEAAKAGRQQLINAING